MSRPIEQSLSNLIPRWSEDLPIELIDLARSFLAQSRTKCTLKPEEEIARTYACANLACERLKTTLNLPPIEPRPPIPPKNYKKLYTYFARELALSSTSRRSKPSAPKPEPSRPLPERHTPSKETSFSSFRQSRPGKRGPSALSRKEKDERVPEWILPTIRLVCKELETPKAVPHVMAGVESVLCIPPPAGPTDSGEPMRGKLPALIAAVWFFVVVRMRGTGKQGVENMSRKNVVRDVLARAKTDEGVVKRVGEEEGKWRGYYESVEEREVNAWRKEIIRGEWKKLDWFLNVGEGVGVEGDVEEESDDGEEDEEDEQMVDGDGRPVGKMDRYDYLSEANVREDLRWAAWVKTQVELAIARGPFDDGGGDKMDTRED